MLIAIKKSVSLTKDIGVVYIGDNKFIAIFNTNDMLSQHGGHAIIVPQDFMELLHLALFELTSKTFQKNASTMSLFSNFPELKQIRWRLLMNSSNPKS